MVQLIQANSTATSEVQEERNNYIILTSALLYSFIRDIGLQTKKELNTILEMPASKRPVAIRRLERLNLPKFLLLNEAMRESVIAGLNAGGFESKFIIEQTLGRRIRWNKPTIYKSLPTSDAFKITNRYLQKSVLLKRAEVDTKALSKIINESANKGIGFEATARRLEIALGIRDKTGRLLTQQAIKTGMASTNGLHYKYVRIARQEIRRVQGMQDFNVLQEARDKGINMRLRMLARLISTSRSQSATMNGQMDGEPYASKGKGKFNSRYSGRFQYPDGRYYALGQAPIQWSINDREFTVQVFEEEAGDPIYTSLNEYQKNQENMFDIEF